MSRPVALKLSRKERMVLNAEPKLVAGAES